MNDTLLALMSALAIYGFSTLALPSTGWDTPGEIASSDDQPDAVIRPDEPEDDTSEIG